MFGLNRLFRSGPERLTVARVTQSPGNPAADPDRMDNLSKLHK